MSPSEHERIVRSDGADGDAPAAGGSPNGGSANVGARTGRWVGTAGFLLLLAIAVLGAALNYRFRSYVFDDAFITYRYAQNFAAGHGLVFNPGERVLGTSSPLYAVLLGVLAKLGPAPDVWSGLLFCGALGGLALTGGWLLRAVGAPRAALVFAALVASGFGDVRLFFGLETPLYALLLFLAVVAARAGREWWVGLLCGLAFLTRHDAVLFAALVFGWWWWRCRRLPLRAVALAAAVAAPWLLFAQLYYGSIFPNTLGAKAGEVSFAEHLLGSAHEQGNKAFAQLRHYGVLRFPKLVTHGLALLTLCMLFAGARRVLRRERAAALLLAFPLALWLAYGVIGPPIEHSWHLLPGAYFLLWLGLASAAVAWAGVPRWLASAACGAVVLALIGQLRARVDPELRYHLDAPFYRARTETYRQLAQWLQRTGLDDLRVLTHEPGYFAYLSRVPVIDGAGLVTRGVKFHGGAAGRDTVESLIARFAPEAVLPLNGYPPAWFYQGYVPTVTGYPARAVQVRADVLEVRWPRIVASLRAAPSFDPTPARPPVLPPFDFDLATDAGWQAWQRAGGWLGEPYRLPGDDRTGSVARRVASTSPGFSTVDAIESPTLRLAAGACDELAFSWGGNDEVMTAAQLVVDGVVVLQRNGRNAPRVALRDELWPVWPWRDRLGVLRLTDLGQDGRRVVLARLRCVRHHRLHQLDDFEATGYDAGRWARTFGDSTTEARALGQIGTAGLGVALGDRSATSLGLAGERELRSRPFLIEHDWLGFFLHDRGGAATRVQLLVDGEPFVGISGSASGRLRPVMWEVAPVRGRRAELVVQDGDPRPERWIGIDEIHLFDREAAAGSQAAAPGAPGGTLLH